MVHFTMLRSPRYLNVHSGQQIASFGLMHLIGDQQRAIGRLVGVIVMKMENTEAKSCFLKLRLYIWTKMVSFIATTR